MRNIFDIFISEEKEWPQTIGGYTVNYKSPIGEPCPNCGGKTFHALENMDIACCTRCHRLLYVYN